MGVEVGNLRIESGLHAHCTARNGLESHAYLSSGEGLTWEADAPSGNKANERDEVLGGLWDQH